MPKDVIPAIAQIRARSAGATAAQKKTLALISRAQALAALVPMAAEITRQQTLIEERILNAAAEAIKAGAVRGFDGAEASFSLFGEGFSSEVLMPAWMAAAGRLRSAGYEPGDLFERARQLYGFTISWAGGMAVGDAKD